MCSRTGTVRLDLGIPFVDVRLRGIKTHSKRRQAQEYLLSNALIARKEKERRGGEGREGRERRREEWKGKERKGKSPDDS
jgi:hypothetical protein